MFHVYTQIMKDKSLGLNRRSFLASAAALISAPRLLSAAEPCTLVPEAEEGPYYIDFDKLRSDITEGRPGVPVQLRIQLLDAKGCAPIENAALDIWHCDALGVYSGFTAAGGGERSGRGFGTPRGGSPPRGARGGRGGGREMDETRFLRGVQVTNKQGMAEFVTVYPGWYAGRTIHIHLKAHVGGRVSHTGQIYFPEDVTEQIAKMEPYVNHSDVHRTLHREDNIYMRQGGAQTTVKLERLQKGTNAGGFVATITAAINSL
jgi:protocatechuate 3,4-dioxygenase beta subunit